MTALTNNVSRRTALRGLGGASLATALAFGTAGQINAHSDHQMMTTTRFAPTSGDDPASVIEAYIAAANAGDLEAILALYADDAFHIALPSPDGSAGVCVGKEQFTMWYEQSLANGERVELEDGSLAVDGNQASFVARISSEPWRKLGVEELEAHSEVVVVDGRIMTHVVLLTPESVRTLQAARGTT
jgi:ketosteroid isomerase-like protein